jgi:arylsulfatase A-like enzyme
VDLVPTLLDYLGIQTIFPSDGLSLLRAIENGESSGLAAYIEEMYPKRGPGDFQGVRTDRWKYIVDRRNDDREEFYDLQTDPGETTNLIDILGEDEQLVRKESRILCDRYLGMETAKANWTPEQREKAEKRLRMLGYIQ